ncbi:MAG: hypothetical protein H7Z15_20435, partial [Rhizobacter sp.]|nr:hypothetical protein [Rhizobacter sp.]
RDALERAHADLALREAELRRKAEVEPTPPVSRTTAPPKPAAKPVVVPSF